MKSIDVNSVDVLIEMSIIGFILYNLSYFIVFIKYLWKISKSEITQKIFSAFPLKCNHFFLYVHNFSAVKKYTFNVPSATFKVCSDVNELP